jgi:hypothetical protein
MTENTTPSVKKYYDYANQQIDEQAILDKYNAATAAQFAAQREQNRQAENKFYNQMYNTQKTTMDTIRQSNAAAVSSGASRGVQAANELSALLGLQSESVAGATELAQANRQTAQEETAAVLENVLAAYQQAAQERSQLVQQGIESASVDVQREASAQQTQSDRASNITQAAENGTLTYLTALEQSGVNLTDNTNTDNINSLDVSLANIGKSSKEGTATVFIKNDWDGYRTANTKGAEIKATIQAICDAYGIDYTQFEGSVNDLTTLASTRVNASGAANAPKGYRDILAKYGIDYALNNKTKYADAMNKIYTQIKAQIRNAYLTKTAQ